MNSKQLIRELESKKMDETLYSIYLDESLIDYQRERYVKAIKNFENLYGEDDIHIFSTPGRSEVTGNHTDHQHGKVLTASINLDIIAIVSKSENVDINSDGRVITFDPNDLEVKNEEMSKSISLCRGVLAKLKQDGHSIGGFKAYMTSDVLVGSGLSSSAAFEVMIGQIENYLYNDGKVSKLEIAIDSQYAENVYYGKPCGLMDQCGCCFGGLVGIDFKDPKNPIVQPVNVDFSDFKHSLCVVDTHADHNDLTDEYAAVPSEVKSVAHYFGKEVLREVTFEQLVNDLENVRKECSDRAVSRALHVFWENERVEKAIDALNNHNFEAFKQCIKESGDSSFKYLQNVFAATDYSHQAVTLALAMSEYFLKGDKGVTRIHGGGFAGTILAFVDNRYVNEYALNMDNCFSKGSCHILKVNMKGSHMVI